MVVYGIGIKDLKATSTVGGSGGVAPKKTGKESASNTEGGDTLRLSPEAQHQLSKLKQRDQEVRAQEAAHMAPARPSGQDQNVAVAATAMEATAASELARQNFQQSGRLNVLA